MKVFRVTMKDFVRITSADSNSNELSNGCIWCRLGGRSTCTMLYGHVESLADRVDHLRQLRALFGAFST
ncbi:MAG: hypothetical protein ACREDQ_00515 [Limisphaerales bacterium]